MRGSPVRPCVLPPLCCRGSGLFYKNTAFHPGMQWQKGKKRLESAGGTILNGFRYRVAAPSIRIVPWAARASCWPLPQQLLPVSAAGGGRRRCTLAIFSGRIYFDLQFQNACGRFETAFSQEGSQRETAFAVPVSCGNIRTAGLLLGSQQVKEKAPANAFGCQRTDRKGCRCLLYFRKLRACGS